MAKSSDDYQVFDYQVKACKTFFNELPKDGVKPIEEKDRLANMKHFKGPIYNITGFDAQHVVAVLSHIVNDKDQFTRGKLFYLRISSSPEKAPQTPNNTPQVTESDAQVPESTLQTPNNTAQVPESDLQTNFEELFQFVASPTKNQPGNGIVSIRQVYGFTSKKYDALNGALKAHYNTDTASFAKDIKQLFKNNERAGIPQATFEVYMILLFEIARRLVTTEDSSERNVEKEAYDILPIGSAIAKLVKLLELGEAKTCRFEDVFFQKRKFHCFSGKPEERRQAIDKINMAILADITESNTERKARRLKELQLTELQELFCYEEQEEEEEEEGEEEVVEELAKKFTGLMKRT